MPDLPQTAEEVWERLQAELGSDVDKRAFEVAVETRAVSEFIEGDSDWDELEGRVLSITATLEAEKRLRSRASEDRPPVTPDFRGAAIAEIFATEAEGRPEVSRFREGHLSDGLLALDDVGTWIDMTANADGEPTHLATLVMAPEDVLAGHAMTAVNRSIAGQVVSLSMDTLTFPRAGKEWAFAVPINRNGVLGELKRVASRLKDRYGWSEPHGVAFVLTGAVPRHLRARIETSFPAPWHRARQSITLEVPLTTSPATVERLYREARAKQLAEDPRPRRLGERHARLATFAFRHREGFTWNEVRKRWHDAHPDDQKQELSNFRRDCHAAFKRVTGERLPWIGQG